MYYLTTAVPVGPSEELEVESSWLGESELEESLDDSDELEELEEVPEWGSVISETNQNKERNI